MKIGNTAFLIDLVNFVFGPACFHKKIMTFHDFPPIAQIVKIHDIFMTTQVSYSDSGLFRFIHNCGHSVKL